MTVDVPDVDRPPARHRADQPALHYRRSFVETFTVHSYAFYAFILFSLGSAATYSVFGARGPSLWVGVVCAALLACAGYASIRYWRLPVRRGKHVDAGGGIESDGGSRGGSRP